MLFLDYKYWSKQERVVNLSVYLSVRRWSYLSLFKVGASWRQRGAEAGEESRGKGCVKKKKQTKHTEVAKWPTVYNV